MYVHGELETVSMPASVGLLRGEHVSPGGGVRSFPLKINHKISVLLRFMKNREYRYQNENEQPSQT